MIPLALALALTLTGAPKPLAKPASPPAAQLTVSWDAPGLYNGRAGLLTITSDVPLVSITGTLAKKNIVSLPASQDRARWYVLAPVDVEKRPGTAPLALVAALPDGKKVALKKNVPIVAAPYETSTLSVDPKFIHLSKKDRVRAAQEARVMDAALKKVSSERLWRGSFARPVAGIETSPFGTRRTYNGVTKSRHFGWDLNGAVGDPITASARGRVVLSADRFYSGGTVVIDHGQGLFTMYFHMSQRDVKEGDIVEKGQGIGLVGATGRVTGPHLHFTFKLSATSLDAKYLVGLDLSADAEDSAPKLVTPASASADAGVPSADAGARVDVGPADAGVREPREGAP